MIWLPDANMNHIYILLPRIFPMFDCYTWKQTFPLSSFLIWVQTFVWHSLSIFCLSSTYWTQLPEVLGNMDSGYFGVSPSFSCVGLRSRFGNAIDANQNYFHVWSLEEIRNVSYMYLSDVNSNLMKLDGQCRMYYYHCSLCKVKQFTRPWDTYTTFLATSYRNRVLTFAITFILVGKQISKPAS